MQSRTTETIKKVKHLSYEERPRSLGLFCLKKKGRRGDIIESYKREGSAAFFSLSWDAFIYLFVEGFFYALSPGTCPRQLKKLIKTKH